MGFLAADSDGTVDAASKNILCTEDVEAAQSLGGDVW